VKKKSLGKLRIKINLSLWAFLIYPKSKFKLIVDMGQRIKLVVMDEHTLGYVHPKMQNYICIFRSLQSKGAPFRSCDIATIPLSKNWRLASSKDFEEYRCVFGSFGNKEIYEFADA
jgi:hypothetical protein